MRYKLAYSEPGLNVLHLWLWDNKSKVHTTLMTLGDGSKRSVKFLLKQVKTLSLSRWKAH